MLGAFGCGNIGADAAHAAMLATVRSLRPSAPVVSVVAGQARQPSGDRHGVIEMRWRSRRPWLRQLDRLLLGLPGWLATVVRAWRAADQVRILVLPSPQLFADYRASSQASRLGLLIWILAARARGTPIAITGLGALPFRGRLERKLAATICNAATYRSFRDSISKSSVAELGIDVGRDPVCPALLFRLEGPASGRAGSEPVVDLRVAVDVVSEADWPRDAGRREDYLEKLAQFVHWLLDRGLTVYCFNGNADRPDAAHELISIVTGRRLGQAAERLHTAACASIDDLMAAMAGAGVVVASHHHAVTAALKLRRPVLSVGMCDASAAVLSEMGFPSFSQRIGDFDGNLLIDQFTRLTVGRKAYESSIVEIVAEMERRIAEEEARLALLL